MIRFADTLNSKNYTVKALNAIAKQMGLKGYSKLRKAELAEMIAASIDMPVILDVENESDHADISEIMAAVAEAVAETEPAESTVEQVKAATPDEGTEDAESALSELLTAYHSMKATWNRVTGTTQVKIGIRLRRMRAEVKAMGFNPVKVGMGICVA